MASVELRGGADRRPGHGGGAMSAAWWGVNHSCDGVVRVYPVLHWADEPTEGTGPRRAFECDACGKRYAFFDEAYLVRRLATALAQADGEALGTDYMMYA